MIQKRNISVIIAVLCIVQGAAAVTGLNRRLTQKLKQMQTDQSRLKQELAKMPEKERDAWYNTHLVAPCALEVVLREYGKEKGLDHTSEFIKGHAEEFEESSYFLYLWAFQTDIHKKAEAAFLQMSEAELRSYYEKNRDKKYRDNTYIFNQSSFEAAREQIQEMFEHELRLQQEEQIRQQYSAKIEAYCKKQQGGLTSSCANEVVQREYVKEKGLDRTPEFVEKREKLLERITLSLYAQDLEKEVRQEMKAEAQKMSFDEAWKQKIEQLKKKYSAKIKAHCVD